MVLVLSRQQGERVRIGNSIDVIVVDIRKDKVRLGFDAPADIPVHRAEVFEAIKEETKANGNRSNQSYEHFRNCLETGDYLEAAQIYAKNNDIAGDNEKHQLINGLAQRLERYEGKIK